MLAVALLLASRGLAYSGAQALAIAAACIGGLALIGYVFGAQALYAFKSYSQVGPSSAASLLLLAIGTLAGMPDRGITGLALANSIGGALTRRLVPVAFGAPLLLASLAQFASQRGIVRAELATALFVVATTAVLGAVILRTAHSIHRLDEIRSRSEALLRESSSRVRHLAAVVAAAESAIVSFDSLGRVVTWNPSAERLLGRRAADAIGRHASEVFAFDAERRLPGAIEDVVRNTEVKRMKLAFQTPRGQHVEAVLTLSPLIDRERHTVGACAVLEENRDALAPPAPLDREA
jgi:PAS domain S-box-containing protein